MTQPPFLPALAGMFALAACAATPTQTCDRACLEGHVDAYLEAVIAKDPDRLPLADDVAFVENLQPLALGEGSWATIDARGSYSHYFADPASGNAGFIGTVRENGVPAILDVRLKIESGRIAEVESLIIRDPFGATRYETDIGSGPVPEWLEAVPPGERLSRRELVATMDRYFTTMERNDGSGDYSFFHPACNRLEHATQTTNMDPPQPYGHIADPSFTGQTCREQWGTGFLGFVTEIRDRRELVVDEERQAALSFITLDHNGTVRELDLAGLEEGQTATMPPYFGVPRTLQVGEGFLIRDHMIYRIEMTLFEPPYGSRQPWPESGAAGASDRR